MRALVHSRYGRDGVEVAEIDAPTIGTDGVLVRVRAASVNAVDWHVVLGLPYIVRLSAGLRRPKEPVPGVDLAGEVVEVGADVTDFVAGDQVFGARSGAFAELVAGRSRNFVAKPPEVTFEQAAAVPTAAVTALQALRDKAGVQPGQRVLVTGAGGGVGSFAVQIAKALGADVTAVTRGASIEAARTNGANRVIDDDAVDFTRAADRYDVICDVAGSRSLGACARVLAPGGVFVVVGAPNGNWVAPIARPAEAAIRSRLGSRRFRPFLAHHNHDDLVVLADLLASSKITPLIDRTYPLVEAATAIDYVASKRARGKVVITI